jgi:uncharacterized protein (TIGR03067 family)
MRSFSLVALVGLALPLAAEHPKEWTDQDRLQGEWVMVGLDVRVQPGPAAKLAGTTLVIKKDTYTTVVKKTEYPATFTLDPAQDPKHIDMLGPDAAGPPQPSGGIYKLEGDKLVICRGQTPGGDRPRNFASSATSDVFVVTWEWKPNP